MREVLLDDNIIRLYELGKPRRPENFIAAFFWGDRINISDAPQNNQHVVTLTTRTYNPQTGRLDQNYRAGRISLTTRFRDTPLLKVRFIDVGQGDGAMIVTPKSSSSWWTVARKTTSAATSTPPSPTSCAPNRSTATPSSSPMGTPTTSRGSPN